MDIKGGVSEVVRAFRNAIEEFIATLFPDVAWKRTLKRVKKSHGEYPVIKFPEHLILEEKYETHEGEGEWILLTTKPGTYGLVFPQEGPQGRRRAVVEALGVLAEFAEYDHITFNDIKIEIRFDKERTKREKGEAVSVV